MPMTKAAFLAAYRTLLAKDIRPDEVDFVIAVARATILGRSQMWNVSTDRPADAWRDIGGTGRPTLAALRALPEE
jgi:hypothetical protein